MKVARVRLALRRLLLHRSGGQPGLARTYVPEGRGPPDQRALGRPGPGPGRLRLRRRPGRDGGRRCSGRAAQRNGLKVRPAGHARSRSPGGRRRGRGLQRAARRDRRAHPRGQRQPGRRGAGPPRRAGRAAGGVVPRPARRPCSTCCGGSAYPSTGDQLYDGSGLSRQNRLSTGHARRGARGSPRARTTRSCARCSPGCRSPGFTGSLAYRFDKGPADARGRVRAKTGTLTGVHGLAGVADDVSGGRMAFVVVADRVGPLKELERADADRPDRGGAGRVQVRRRVEPMSAHGHLGPPRNDRLGPRRQGGVPARRARARRSRRAEAVEAVEELRAGAERSTPLVREFTGLVASERTAPVLVVDRPGWIQANADGFATVIAPLIEKLQEKKGAPSAAGRGDRLADHRRRARRPARVPRLQGARAVRPVPRRRRTSTAGCCWSRRTSCTPSASSRPTRTTSGSGSACTRRPTGCSSPRCRG